MRRSADDYERDLIAFQEVLQDMAAHPEDWHPADMRLQADLCRAAWQALLDAEAEEDMRVGGAVDLVLARFDLGR